MSMLAPEPMLEANLFVVGPDIEVVTAALARMEILQLEEALPEGWTPSPEWTGLANKYTSLMQRLTDLLNALGVHPVGGVESTVNLRPSLDWREAEARLNAVESRVQSWQQEMNAAKQRLQRLKLGESQVELLLPLDVRVEDLRGLQYQTITLGIMPAENVSRVAEALFQIPFILIPLQTRKDQALVLAASSTDHAAVLDRALKSAFFEPITVPEEALGRPSEALSALQSKARKVQAERNELDAQGHKLAAELSSELSSLWRRVTADARVAEAIRRFAKHGDVFLISGWVPASDLEAVKTAVERAAGHPIAMEVLRADPNRQSVPSLVRTPKWLRPFEDLVTTFGLCSYNELDPTLIVTLSFLIMYGMMFGDLGHGLLLLIAGLWLRARTGLWNSGGGRRRKRDVLRAALWRRFRTTGPARRVAPAPRGHVDHSDYRRWRRRGVAQYRLRAKPGERGSLARLAAFFCGKERNSRHRAVLDASGWWLGCWFRAAAEIRSVAHSGAVCGAMVA